MIPKHELVELATQANLRTHVIEKDYVLGWLLAGINQHPALYDAVTMPVRHDYSDSPEHGICIQSYSYAEVFAEKIRALKERTRPRDLYDVVNLYRRPESREVAGDVRSVLTQKCQFKTIAFPSLTDLDEHREVCAAGWDDQLGHQLQTLPPFDSYWGELPSFFSWLENPESALVGQLSAIPAQYEGEANTITLAAGSPSFNTLERVRFAAVNRLCVELDYQKESGQRSTYVVEPYSLRTTTEGNMLLYGVKLPAAEIRCFRTDRIISATVTRQPFTPRYSIDFIPEGPVRLSARQTSTSLGLPQRHSSAPRVRPGRTRVSRSSGGPKYVFRCSVCGKQFTRTTYDSQLNPHKNKQGYPCYGTTGFYVKTRY